MHAGIDQLLRENPFLSSCAADIELAFSALRTGFATDGKVMLCASADCAAASGRWAAQLLRGETHPRPLDRLWRQRLGTELADKLRGALPTLALNEAAALHGGRSEPQKEYLFAQQVWALGKPADVLVCLCPDGGDRAVLLALEAARGMDIITVGMSGRDGGRLAVDADICIRVPAENPAEISRAFGVVQRGLNGMLEGVFFD